MAATTCPLHSRAPVKWVCLCLHLIHPSSFVLYGLSGIMCSSAGDAAASSHVAVGWVPALRQIAVETPGRPTSLVVTGGMRGWGLPHSSCRSWTVQTPAELTQCALMDTPWPPAFFKKQP